MARKPRVEFAGATYHVMCRGNRKELIFWDGMDCERFLFTLGEVAERTGWIVHAYVLMGNHYHLLLETPEPNLVDGMRWFQGTYTQRFNIRHKVCGHLFQGRYKALPVDQGNYFKTVADYVHLNPARAQAFDLESGNIADYEWSSAPAYVRPEKRPSFLKVGSYGLSDDEFGRRRYVSYLNRRVLDILHSANPKNIDEQWRNIRRGWAFGSEEFRMKVQNSIGVVMDGKRRDSFMGEEIRLHDEIEAETIIQRDLAICGLDEAILSELKKSDDRKKAIAWHLRKKTSVRTEWIARRLKMGSTSNLADYIHAVEQARDGRLWRLRRKITK